MFLNRISSWPPGWGRAYVKLTNGLHSAEWMAGQRAGRSFVTSGPMLDMAADGHAPGDTLILEAPGEVKLTARARWLHPLSALEIVVNGRVVQTVMPGADARDLPFDGAVRSTQTGWLAVRAAAPAGYFYAHMNPIYVTVRDRPADARADAKFLLQWIDRLEADLRRRDRLPGPGLDHARMQLDTARSVYRKLLR